MEWQRLESRAIEAVRYDEASGVLEVRFASGRSYRYSGVPRSVVEWLLRTPEKGAFFNRMVRDGYTYVEITEAPEATPDLEQALRASLERGEG